MDVERVAARLQRRRGPDHADRQPVRLRRAGGDDEQQHERRLDGKQRDHDGDGSGHLVLNSTVVELTVQVFAVYFNRG